MHRFLVPAFALLLAACGDKDDSAAPIVDDDQDGFALADDCDDNDPDINPDAEEVTYNGVDDDCDESTLDDDLDGDGYDIDQDCDDEDAAINPGAEEVCDEVDNDCDDDVDGGATDADTWYFDGDADGFGGDVDVVEACEQPTHYVDNADDCNDGHTSINPDADEECDEEDNDCDGVIDEDDAVDADSWLLDSDGDGWGLEGTDTPACVQPTGYVDLDSGGDCDDGDAAINPAADEECDEVDNDCDGLTDEDDAVDAPTWYEDADGDGYGNPVSSLATCSQPSGYLDDDSDCDDSSANIHPGADEYCDGQDWDCDGSVNEDDSVDASTWYADSDSDGYGDAAATTTACSEPTGYGSDDTDCDDDDDDIHPGADEYCNDEDDDCDGTVDENSAVDATTWYVDVDGDGFGSDAFTTAACDQPTGFVDDDSDCDDGDIRVNPDATELLNGVDDDCDGVVDDMEVEDCTNGVDDDYDGLADCEDSDCVDVCIEDCTNGTDDDADGDVDCDDDECYGQSGCEGPYTVELSTDMEMMAWLFGPYSSMVYGDDAASVLYGTVVVDATPYGWTGSSFSCEGELYGASWYSRYGFYYYGTGSSVDYVFSWAPTEANRGLTWVGSCPLTGLPAAYLGVNTYVNDTLYRMDDSGSWYAQYSTSDLYTYNGMPYWYVTWMYDMTQASTISWTGSYSYP